MEKPVLSTAEAADQIIDQNKTTPGVLDARKWGPAVLGAGATITYSFLGNTALVDSNGDGAESRLSRSQMDRIEEVLDLVSDVADITFQRIGSGWSDAGEIKFQKRYTDFGNTATTFFLGGDDPDQLTRAVVTAGRVVDGGTGAAWFSLRHALHEVLHGLGFAHPSDYDGGPAVTTYEKDAAYFQDSLQYTVMSYFFGRETGASYARPPDATLMLHDVVALQKLYGRNTEAFSGDTTYGFGSNTDRTPWTLSGNGDAMFGAIWDSGGTDTIDLSGFTLPSKIDLRQERFSSMNGEVDTMSIAPGARIENAIGGAGDDTLGGNSLDNRLSGHGGADRLTGRLGSDTLSGGTGTDTLLGGGGADALTGGPGADKLTGGARDDRLFGQNGADTVGGGGGNDILMGGNGADRLTASTGDDTLQGGAGADTLFGGAGADVFRWINVSDSEPDSPDRIGGSDSRPAFEHGTDLIDLTRVDANDLRSGNQAFIFGGSGAGHISLSERGRDTIISLHTDRDGIADMVIEVADRDDPLTVWTAADFLL